MNLSEGPSLDERISPVDRADDPRVRAFSMSRDRQLRGRGAMVLDSEKVVLRALKAGHQVRTLLGSREYFERHAELIRAHPEVELLSGSKKLMQDIVGFRIHQGMMAVADRPSNTPTSALGPRIVAMDHLVDVSNVGAIMRGCHAFGIDSILMGEGCPSPYARRAIRVSMGSVFKLKVREASRLEDELTWLKWQGFPIFGAGIWEEASCSREVRFPPRCVLVIGNEDQGLRPEIRNLCDVGVKIPVASTIDSLNAACAASVLLYEMGR